MATETLRLSTAPNMGILARFVAALARELTKSLSFCAQHPGKSTLLIKFIDRLFASPAVPTTITPASRSSVILAARLVTVTTGTLSHAPAAAFAAAGEKLAERSRGAITA